jgi:flagellar protein FliS
MVNNVANAYQQVNIQTGAAFADPHTLIGMLFDGALERIAKAKGAIQQNNIALKGKFIGEAITIVGGLQGTLNMEDNAISNNLFELYDYMGRRLLSANVNNSESTLQEVSTLLLEIKAGWASIPKSVRADFASKHSVG